MSFMPIMIPTGDADIQFSASFPGVSTTRLSRTPGAAGDRRSATVVFPFKPAVDSTRQFVMFQGANTNDGWWVERTAANKLMVQSAVGNATQYQLLTTASDWTSSAWHWIGIIQDTTNATAGDRIRLYRNGTRITAFDTETYPTQNAQSYLCDTREIDIGGWLGNSLPVSGLIGGRCLLADGYAPSDLSRFFRSNGDPVPNLSGFSYGTTGFLLEFESSGDMGNDTSGNGNDFTVSGTVSQSTDTPTS